MDFKLLATTKSKAEADLLKGRLTAAGVRVQLDAQVPEPDPAAKPALFTVYVHEQDWYLGKRALHSWRQPAWRQFGKSGRAYAAIFLTAFLAALILGAVRILQDYLKK